MGLAGGGDASISAKPLRRTACTRGQVPTPPSPCASCAPATHLLQLPARHDVRPRPHPLQRRLELRRQHVLVLQERRVYWVVGRESRAV